MKNMICIYHGNCADGFTAAWAVWKRFPEAKFHAGFYGDNPPDVAGMDVVLVDFSYKKPVLEEMAKTARSVLILDHHKSAFEDLCDYEEPSFSWDTYIHDVLSNLDPMQFEHKPFVRALFDMKRSGARLAWDFFHQDKEVPKLVLHVEDRDLWKFMLHGTREIQAVIFSHPYLFERWNSLALQCENNNEAMISEGAAIERKHMKDVRELVQAAKRNMIIGGHIVLVANLPYTLASDACNLMCGMDVMDWDGPIGKTPFAASYTDTPKGRSFSLRSVGDFDVSAIAKAYGGGGHKNAAGFIKPIGWEGDK